MSQPLYPAPWPFPPNIDFVCKCGEFHYYATWVKSKIEWHLTP